jgi:hypothetical protein
LTIVGHKFYGPKIGALYARNCLKSNNNAQNEKIAPIHHQFSGANQENGLRPGFEKELIKLAFFYSMNNFL